MGLIVISVLQCSFAIVQHSSRRENTCDENPVAFLEVNNSTVLHSVLFITTEMGCVLWRGITSGEFSLEMLLILPVKRSIHTEQQHDRAEDRL